MTYLDIIHQLVVEVGPRINELGFSKAIVTAPSFSKLTLRERPVAIREVASLLGSNKGKRGRRFQEIVIRQSVRPAALND